jgi:hypothetical protein
MRSRRDAGETAAAGDVTTLSAIHAHSIDSMQKTVAARLVAIALVERGI